jgi:ribosomal protein S18 acetylase RimI-like enzyme
VGAALVAEAERRAAAAGARAIHVVANHRALGFYQACGFRVVGQVMTKLEPAPEMRKALGPASDVSRGA